MMLTAAITVWSRPKMFGARRSGRVRSPVVNGEAVDPGLASCSAAGPGRRRCGPSPPHLGRSRQASIIGIVKGQHDLAAAGGRAQAWVPTFVLHHGAEGLTLSR